MTIQLTTSDGQGVPGPPSVSATTLPFLMPPADGETQVTVTAGNVAFLFEGMSVLMQVAGTLQVAVTPLPGATSFQAVNTGAGGSATPGTAIPSGSVFAPSGATGPTGPAGITQTTLLAGFSQPAAGTPIAINVASSSITAAGGFISIPVGGQYQVLNVIDATHLNVTPTSASSNAAPTTSIPSLGTVAIAGAVGPLGPSIATTASFTMPAISSSVTAIVGNSGGYVPGQWVYVVGGGYLTVASIIDATHMSLTNPGLTGNAAPTTVIAGAQMTSAGAPGTVAGEVSTAWIPLTTDGATTIFTLSPNLAANEECSIVAYVEILQMGASGVGGSITRYCEVQNVGGVITGVLTGATSAFDLDASRPTPPANLPAILASTTAQIVSASGPTLALQVTRATGVNTRVRATVSVSRLTLPITPFASSISPASGTTTGGTPFTLSGDNLSDATAVTLDGVAATILTRTQNTITGTSNAGSAGTGNVVVTTPEGTSSLTNAWTYVAGIIPTVASVTPNTCQAEGKSGFNVVIIGANFTGTTAVKLGGVAQTFVVNSNTQITIANVAAGTAGNGDVQITSSTSNVSAPGNNLWFYLPLGIVSWHRPDLGLTPALGTAVVTAWPDQGSLNWAYIQQTTNVNSVAADALVNGKPTVISENENLVISQYGFRGTTYFTGAAMTALVIGARPFFAANEEVLSFANASGTPPDGSQAGGFAVTGLTTGTTELTRNSVSATASVSPSTSAPFALSVRADGVSQNILRLNGTDIATVAGSGAFDANCMFPGTGFGQFGLWGGVPCAEMHTADVMLFSRELLTADFVVMSAYSEWRYGIPAV